MTIHRLHALHKGELVVQKRRNTPNEISRSVPGYIHADMPSQHADFFSALSYLPLATLDNKGRPWVSLLVTQKQNDSALGIKVAKPNQLEVTAETSPYDPFLRALKRSRMEPFDNRLFAGVGIDFSSRRRNKLAGIIKAANIDADGKVSLTLSSDQHLGNCPKYITVRSLEYCDRDAEVMIDNFDVLNVGLPESCKTLIDQASTVFLATKHTSDIDYIQNDQSDMGLNHRGGSPGFVRVYEESDGDTTATYLFLPDHSGNRFYQSLGNIQIDKHVGLLFPDFRAGNVLYVTGKAENLFGKDAERLMPRVSLLTRIRITGVVYVKQGLNLTMTSDEQLSPYNPPVRCLRAELEKMGLIGDRNSISERDVSASLVSVKQLASSVSTFTFNLSEPINISAPGGFGVFDFSGFINAGYRHMDEANPQLVNEDYIRTWTLSNSPEFDVEKKQFSSVSQVNVTVKRKPGGLISNFLHDIQIGDNKQASEPVKVKFKGAGTGFSCFSKHSKDEFPEIPPYMLWVAGGVGITPFMAMWDGILSMSNSLPVAEALETDIVLLFSCRGDDMALLTHFLEGIPSVADHIKIKIHGYQSTGVDNSNPLSSFDQLQQEFSQHHIHLKQRRLDEADFEFIDNLSSREVFLCGPDSLMDMARNSVHCFGDSNMRIHRESYFF